MCLVLYHMYKVKKLLKVFKVDENPKWNFHRKDAKTLK